MIGSDEPLSSVTTAPKYAEGTLVFAYESATDVDVSVGMHCNTPDLTTGSASY